MLEKVTPLLGSRVEAFLEVADDKSHTSAFVRKLDQLHLGTINPITVEIGENHMCLVVYVLPKGTYSLDHVKSPGMVVYPLQSHVLRSLGQKERPQDKCFTVSRAPEHVTH
jgi:hypothetical protein